LVKAAGTNIKDAWHAHLDRRSVPGSFDDREVLGFVSNTAKIPGGPGEALSGLKHSYDLIDMEGSYRPGSADELQGRLENMNPPIARPLYLADLVNAVIAKVEKGGERDFALEDQRVRYSLGPEAMKKLKAAVNKMLMLKAEFADEIIAPVKADPVELTEAEINYLWAYIRCPEYARGDFVRWHRVVVEAAAMDEVPARAAMDSLINKRFLGIKETYYSGGVESDWMLDLKGRGLMAAAGLRL
jgi:hypothetical protein